MAFGSHPIHGERTAVFIPRIAHLARMRSLPVLECCVPHPQPAGILLMFSPRGLPLAVKQLYTTNMSTASCLTECCQFEPWVTTGQLWQWNPKT
jgi:hypothetical protein